MKELESTKPTDASALNPRDAKTAEIERIYALPDRWLARELMTLARYIRQREQVYCATSARHNALLFECVPEIASRLGETSFQNGERSSRFRAMDGRKLREATASLLSPSRVMDTRMSRVLLRGFNAYSLLLNDPCDGSPIAFGLDRIAPPDLGCPDPIAAEVYFVSDRRGHRADFEWRPEFAIDVVLDDELAEFLDVRSRKTVSAAL